MKFAEYFGTCSVVNQRISEYLQRIPEEYYSNRVLYAWERGGLFIPSWSSTNQYILRSWINVVAHQVATGVMACTLASKLVGHTTSQDIVEAAMIHDSYKRCESEKKLDDLTAIAFGAFLRNLGFNDRIVKLAITTGDHGLKRILEGDTTLAEELVFYSDCCVSNYEIVGYKKRFDDLYEHFLLGGRYYHANAMFQSKYGKTHREMYDSVVLPLEERLAKLLGINNPSQIYQLCT